MRRNAYQLRNLRDGKRFSTHEIHMVSRYKNSGRPAVPLVVKKHIEHACTRPVVSLASRITFNAIIMIIVYRLALSLLAL